MPKKKKENAEDIRSEENSKNDLQPEMDSDFPLDDQDEVLEGEVIQDGDASIVDDDIPIEEKLDLAEPSDG